MHRTRIIYIIFFCSVFFLSCGTRSSLHQYPKIRYYPYYELDVIKYFDGPHTTSHNRKVFVTECFFAKDEYEIIAEITIKAKWPLWPPWVHERILDDLADEAKILGATAVIEANVWWSWLYWLGYGKGKAVVVNQKGVDRIAITEGLYR